MWVASDPATAINHVSISYEVVSPVATLIRSVSGVF